jgi:hypothetical protein
MIDVWLGRPLPTEGVFSALPPATSVLNCPLARVGLTSCIISKTTPNSVSFPVPMTIPEPWPSDQHPQWRRDVPLLTKVPMKAIQCLSPRALPPPSPCVSSPSPRSQILIFFLLGLVSPVRADSSISSATEVIKRISAGIRSPTENVTRSPGRRALARGERD